jgi:hypothetical protein
MNYFCPKCHRLYLAPGKCEVDQSQLLPAPTSLTLEIVHTIASDPQTVRTIVELGCYLVKKWI